MIILTVHRCDGTLHREEWRFYLWVEQRALVVDWYERQARLSTRHKFRTTAAYQRLGLRRRDEHPAIRQCDVPMPPDVVQEAFRKLIEEVRVAFHMRPEDTGRADDYLRVLDIPKTSSPL